MKEGRTVEGVEEQDFPFGRSRRLSSLEYE